jgi:hypothetical protein
MRMSSAPAVMLMLLALMLLPARPASAQGWWRWLEELSGPGPLTGPEFEFTVHAITSGQGGRQGLFSDVDPKNAGKVKGAIRVDVAYMWGHNNQTYAAGVSAPANVHAFAYLGAFDGAVRPWLDLGAGAGVLRFSNTPGGAFSKFALQPVRVIWKPFAMKHSTDREFVMRQAFQIRYTGMVVPGGFDAADFGAVVGSYASGTKYHNTLSLVVSVPNIVAR